MTNKKRLIYAEDVTDVLVEHAGRRYGYPAGDAFIKAIEVVNNTPTVEISEPKLSNEELADLFGYCARLASLVAPAQAKRYYEFTFDGAVKDTFYGLAMLYAGEGIAKNIEEFKQDECYGPTLAQMLSDIRRILNGEIVLT